MKITFLTYTYPYPRRGFNVGIERSIEGITQTLARKGHEVSVITTLARNGSFTREELASGVQIYRVNDLRNMVGRVGCVLALDLLSINYFARAHRNLLKSSDVIHTYVPYFLDTPDVPLVSTFFHDEMYPNLVDHLHLPANKYLWKKTYQRCSAIVGISDYSTGYLRDIGVPQERIHTVYMGVDTGRYRPLPPDPELSARFEGLNVLLFVGSYQNRKGLRYLVKALPMVLSRQENTVLLLVGSGHAENLGELVAELGLGKHVLFEGPVPDSRLSAYYNACDLFVLPSEQEGFGIVSIEAMACGKTVVSTNVTAIPEVVGDAGVLVEPRNPEQLAEAILGLLEDPGRRRRLGERAYRRVTEKFTWDKVVDDLLEIYRAA